MVYIEIENKKLKEIETIERNPNINQKSLDINESMIFQTRMESIEQRVKSIMMSDKYSRKKDWWLIVLYWAKMGYIKLVIPLDQLNKITPPESITRIKRKLLERAKNGEKELSWLLKDEENLEIREKNEVLYEDFFKHKPFSELVDNIK